MRSDHLFRTIRNIDILRQRSSQILIIKTPILKHLACLDPDSCPCRLMHPQPEDPRDLLPQIKYLFSGRSMNQLCRLPLLLYLNRKR